MDAGRVLWVSSCPTPLLKMGDVKQVAQDHVEKSSEHLQRRSRHKFFPVLCSSLFPRALGPLLQSCFGTCPALGVRGAGPLMDQTQLGCGGTSRRTQQGHGSRGP